MGLGLLVRDWVRRILPTTPTVETVIREPAMPHTSIGLGLGLGLGLG